MVAHHQLMARLACLVLLALPAISGCVSVPPNTGCFAAGQVSDGASCESTRPGHPVSRLSVREFVDYLEAQAARNCVPVGHWDEKTPTLWVQDLAVCADDQTKGTLAQLPKRAAAVCRAFSEDAALKLALEEACRLLGPRCSYGLRAALKGFK